VIAAAYNSTEATGKAAATEAEAAQCVGGDVYVTRRFEY